jgi:integrase
MGIEVRVQSSYFASLLIASGLDVKVVQAWLRHASAKTTLDTCHLWPDEDESYRAALYAVQALAEGGRGASGSA